LQFVRSRADGAAVVVALNRNLYFLGSADALRTVGPGAEGHAAALHLLPGGPHSPRQAPAHLLTRLKRKRRAPLRGLPPSQISQRVGTHESPRSAERRRNQPVPEQD